MNKFTAELCESEMIYSDFQQTFSPLYSNYGLVFGDTAGAGELWLHYNRSAAQVFSNFCVFDGENTKITKKPVGVRFANENCNAGLAFYDTDAFIISGESKTALKCFCANGKEMLEYWIDKNCDKCVYIRGYVKNGDGRDPDEKVPVLIGLKAVSGKLCIDGDKISVTPDENGKIAAAFAMNVLETDIDEIKAKLCAAPENFNVGEELTAAWADKCIGNYTPAGNDPEVRKTLTKAVCSLLFNLTKAPGNLNKYISAYPNRGEYPTHFTWDSYFQNLAFEMMDPELAKHSLLQLAENLRPDGKLPQFICSTWGRPQSAQPALMGWASIRYIKQTGDMDFAAKILPALEKNNKWWLQSRISRYGVIFCPDGLETGQDNSPRFDNGPTLATDMNSYLLRQLKVTAEIAKMLGETEKEQKWLAAADKLEQAMLNVLYDEEQNFFFDADAKTGAKVSVMTPCGLLPLWAGISFPEDKAKKLIENYLLNKNIFFGDIPFPSVSYSDPTYEHEEWWRGPTWMPESWLMLEVLDLFGYKEEYAVAMKRLYDVLVKDNILHELFDSKTGEGMGAAEQSWTAAVYIKMNSILEE